MTEEKKENKLTVLDKAEMTEFIIQSSQKGMSDKEIFDAVLERWGTN